MVWADSVKKSTATEAGFGDPADAVEAFSCTALEIASAVSPSTQRFEPGTKMIPTKSAPAFTASAAASAVLVPQIFANSGAGVLSDWDFATPAQSSCMNTE